MIKNLLAVMTVTALWVSTGWTQKIDLGTNLWNAGWHKEDDIFLPSIKRVNPDDRNPWNPQFLKDLRPYSTIRFMDWSNVNNATRTQFSQRKLKTDPNQVPAAYEWMIDLCNREKKNIWLCIPHGADWDYSLHLANLLKYGSDKDGTPRTSGRGTNPPLDSSLKIYIEYSNETWNGQFTQAAYVRQKGAELGLPGHDDNTRGAAYHVYAAMKHFENFDKVFGKNNNQVVKVIAAFSGWDGIAQHMVSVLDDKKVNPNGVKADALAVAPYFGHNVNGNDAEWAKKMREDIDKVAASCARHQQIAKSGKLKLIAYEGGQHIARGANKVNSDPEMEKLYLEYFKAIGKYFAAFSVTMPMWAATEMEAPGVR